MTERHNVVDFLNELLAREQAGLAPRLMQSTVFVSGLSVNAFQVVTQLAHAADGHAAGLAGMILELGGTPGPRRVTARLAEPHFQEVSSTLPLLVADQEGLISAYQRAGEQLAAEPRAVELTGRILERHRGELACLASHITKGSC